MQAKTREQYVAAWQSHVMQLATLALAATTPEQFDADRATYERIRADLFAMIERAAAQQKFT